MIFGNIIQNSNENFTVMYTGDTFFFGMMYIQLNMMAKAIKLYRCIICYFLCLFGLFMKCNTCTGHMLYSLYFCLCSVLIPTPIARNVK